MADVVVGIDMGTGSSKGVVTTADGRVLASATRAHGVSMPRPGHVEVDAVEVWWGDVVALCRELLPQVEEHVVRGVCVSGVGPSLVLTDGDGEPVRPAILYGIDMRAHEEIEELTARYGADEVLRRCGKALSSQAVGPKVLWVRRHEPEAWARVRRWYGSNSFVVGRLTGEYVQDHHTASQCDPLYDIAAQDWNADWAEDVVAGVPLPRLAWPGEVVGHVLAGAAEETGLPEGTPVCAGTVDAWAEAHSAGVGATGDLMLMYGSTMFFVQVLDGLEVHPQLWTTSGVHAGSYTMAAGMATSGILTSWVRDLTGGADFADLVAEASRVPPGADGLVLLPYFAGERTPVFDPRARGVVAGLTLSHTRAHLFRAAYEGIACGVRQVIDLLDASAAPPRRLVAVGGGTQGDLWTQIVSDVTGLPQDLPEQGIGASYGDALLAATGTGLVPPDTQWARVARTVEPDPARREVYDGLLQSYAELYPATRTIVHRMARLQEEGAGRQDPPVA
ncbi:MAG: Carbohydrate kinase, FGGY family [uncultured Quadrisphaera sp.]|uniref:Carbohydrate kinase, FGGY family n=1 Tax=uncultured Quadrisphaera sp. TaxID=904978 RepID=A0A6J4NXJ3_9ACTN|nr:MAG: Carbohydrate kinase, FGGY family [uncultured Quadrisphaera sp.]